MTVVPLGTNCDDTEWRYLKVAQEMFEREPWASLGELEAAIGLAGD